MEFEQVEQAPHPFRYRDHVVFEDGSVQGGVRSPTALWPIEFSSLSPCLEMCDAWRHATPS